MRSLPEADLPSSGLRGWLLQSESGQVLFGESISSAELTIPEHSHGDQWGVILDGKMDLTINGQTQSYDRGDTYFIPAGMLHRVRIYPGLRAVDYFADSDRFRVGSQGA